MLSAPNLVDRPPCRPSAFCPHPCPQPCVNLKPVKGPSVVKHSVIQHHVKTSVALICSFDIFRQLANLIYIVPMFWVVVSTVPGQKVTFPIRRAPLVDANPLIRISPAANAKNQTAKSGGVHKGPCCAWNVLDPVFFVVRLSLSDPNASARVPGPSCRFAHSLSEP